MPEVDPEHQPKDYGMRLRTGILHRLEPEGTSILFDSTTGDVHTLNSTGTVILTQLLADNDLRRITASLTTEFEVSATTAHADVLALIDSLSRGGFLEQEGVS